METKSTTIVEAFENIYKLSKDSLLIMERFDNVKNEIEQVSNYFKINDIQAILLSNLIYSSCFEKIELIDIYTHFGLEKMKFMSYFNHFNILEEKKIIEKRANMHYDKDYYNIKSHLINFIITNQPIPKELITNVPVEDDFSCFLGKMDKLSDEKDRSVIEFDYFTYQFQKLIDDSKKFKLVNYVISNKLQLIDCFVFFDTIIDTMENSNNDFPTNLHRTIEDFTDRKRDTFEYISKFLEGKTILNQLELVVKNKTEFGGSHRIKLSDKAIKMLDEMEGIKIGFKETKNTKLVYPDKIQKTNLFYNPAEQLQMNTVLKSMSHTAFSSLQKRLKSNNLPIGLTSLLYGAPGTGKTETVYQIAKKYNRPVYKVEISETKSMWFGESQKLVKKIFTDYYDIKKEEKICPILLFNEADAIIGKRKEAGSSNVADTENAIQNILLEELENFDGILFATSNLVNNLDAAFERRFLFKIKFDTPNIENAAKIWRNKLPILSAKQAQILSKNFNFSGGEMENIARKCVMEEVVLGNSLSFETIVQFCKNEKWSNNSKSNKIGF